MNVYFSQVIQEQLNKHVLDSLVEFIKKHEFGISSEEWRQRSSEIPTAALMLGKFILTEEWLNHWL